MLSFTGTDTIPSIFLLKQYYEGKGLIGGSVAATEHSVMCAGKGNLKLLDGLSKAEAKVWQDDCYDQLQMVWRDGQSYETGNNTLEAIRARIAAL